MLSVGHELADPAWSFPRAKALIFHSTSNLGTDCCTTLTPYPYDQDAHTVELEFFLAAQHCVASPPLAGRLTS